MTAWTTPRTWVTGEVLSSTNFNTHIRDNLAFYGGADSMGSSPPATPGNGQNWVYPADAANGVYWHFVYITALSAWAFVGGSPLTSYTGTASSTTSTSYVDLTNNAPVTVPRAGTYVVLAEADGTTGTTGYFCSVYKNALALDADAVVSNALAGGAGRPMIVAGLAASALLKFQHRSSSGSSVTTRSASLMVWPRTVT